MSNACRGLVALVTGASKGGTGTSLAVRLASAGAAVAVTARSEDGLADCVQQVEALGGRAIALRCDLSKPDGGREDLVARAAAELGPIDILVNNAAGGPYQPFIEFTRDQLVNAVELNVFAPWTLAQQALPGMRERERGWILNVTTSVAEIPPGPPFANSGPSKTGTLYGGSKAMLNRMTVGLASEVMDQGITVNALTPQAAILTPALQPVHDNGMIHEAMFEPLETMVEAGFALCTASQSELHGRIAYSLDLLIELGRPVLDLHGKESVVGWQPADLPARLAAQRAALSEGEAGGYGL